MRTITTSNERDFKGVWIPKEVYLNQDLNWIEKILFVEINSLDKNKRGCFASNEYLADFLETSERTVSRGISKLKKLHLIKQKNFDGRRRILLSQLNLDYAKTSRQTRQKCLGRLDKNVHHINTSNNIDDKKKNNTKKRFKKPTPEQVEEYASSIDFETNGETFCNYYKSKGWMIGKSPMKDWKAAVVTWKKNSNKWSDQNDSGEKKKQPEVSMRHRGVISELKELYFGVTGFFDLNPKQESILFDFASSIIDIHSKLPGDPDKADIDKPADKNGKQNMNCRHSVKYFIKTPDKLANRFHEYVESQYGSMNDMHINAIKPGAEIWHRFIRNEENRLGLSFKTGKQR